MRSQYLVILLLLCSAPLAAQQQQQQPYADQQHRPIKSLSETEVQAYLNGEGMGYAKVAELNHYPGPRHVLDLADSLALTVEQRSRAEAIFREMNDEAIRLGRQVVAKEAELERLFAEQQADEGRLQGVLHEIGNLEAALRGVHLRAHVAMRKQLTAQQIARYDELRGYGSSHRHSGHNHHL